MKQRSSEWIAIAELMSGVAAVVILLLAVSLSQRPATAGQAAAAEDTPPKVADAPPPPPPAPVDAPEGGVYQRVQAQREEMNFVMGQMQSAVIRAGAASYVTVDAETGTLTLKERAFSRGSACIEPEAKAALNKLEERISDYLRQFPTGRIYVEGHTDDKPVKAPVTDVRRFCTVYDDNFTLSAARAREARRMLIDGSSGIGAEASRRVIVAGYGDSQPLPDIDPGDERNRRVELRFVNAGQQ